MDPIAILTSDGTVSLSLAMIVVSLSILYYRVNALSKRIEVVENDITSYSKEMHEIKQKVTEMFVDVKWIKATLEKLDQIR